MAQKHTRPLLIDGDGLTAMKDETSILPNRKGPTILTPHGGEFSRLCSLTIDEIYDDPFTIRLNHQKSISR